MAIKMRVNKNKESCCCECKKEWKNVSDMYDICIGKTTFTLCRKCSDLLFQKLLKASCMYNAKVKSQEDMQRLRREKAVDLEWEAAEKGYNNMSISKALKGVKGE